MLTPSDLPTIMCIHGQGTNGAIFRLQARRIIQSLEKSFHFAFVDAPFECQPGPGVVPVFSELTPFLRWHCDEATLDKFNVTKETVDEERTAVRELLVSSIEKINREAGNGRGRVAGIMAFSQGTRVATGLMQDPELRKNVHFAILICGTFPVLSIGNEGSRSLASDSSSQAVAKLQVPSMHIHGSYDPWLAEGMRLKQTYYDERLVSTVKFSGGHQVPAGSKEADEVASWVRDKWKQTLAA